MDPNKENIKCEKNGVTKYFSQHQLDITGQSPDGTFDGWVPQTKKPVNIPDAITLPLGADSETPLADPLTLNIVPPIDDPNGVTANPGPVVVDTDSAPVTSVDPAKVEKVDKEPKAPKTK